MHFDDRLATVLRHPADGERAARTQYRQLIDLLGSRATTRDEGLLAAAWLRLGALGEAIPGPERAAVLREPGMRLRNPELALHLAEDEAEVAAAALAVAQLPDDDWEALIPRLPVQARGFLRLRRDLGAPTLEVLERLGIRDRALPVPQSAAVEGDIATDVPPIFAAPPVVPQSARPIPANDLASAEEDSEIGALVRRIESFRKARVGRGAGDDSGRTPAGEGPETTRPRVSAFAFATDAHGRIDWADAAVAPMIVGASLPPAADAARHGRQPLRGVAIDWTGAPDISGAWTIDAAPRFSETGGHFIGYAGRFRRPPAPELVAAYADPSADRMRQLLHELKTPVNAIQGFAEVIQQQLFGPTPHEYRALAAAIAGDAARMLAGFDELDRLARLESGAMALEDGRADLAQIVAALVGQLGEVLRPRNAAFAPDFGETASLVALGGRDAETLCWRLFATITGATGAGEELAVAFAHDHAFVQLTCALPATLAAQADVFAADSPPSRGAVSAGMFGAGFALRLARAEARAAGGDLVRHGAAVVLSLPRLTPAEASPSPAAAGAARG
ncbi:sensor histidine kinase [Altererythrobacter aerius]|uniref:histidine kinase n=1 Tax=Tsuneonella aeria TaxID=1837929 RepID=A0A6I4TEW9_9SPHN|nr:HAMP domain-containing histidine kinase [Tsuneonella aeria]MXO74725.1 sensor histidine kinase [Tsuneonella aeria]